MRPLLRLAHLLVAGLVLSSCTCMDPECCNPWQSFPPCGYDLDEGALKSVIELQCPEQDTVTIIASAAAAIEDGRCVTRSCASAHRDWSWSEMMAARALSVSDPDLKEKGGLEGELEENPSPGVAYRFVMILGGPNPHADLSRIRAPFAGTLTIITQTKVGSFSWISGRSCSDITVEGVVPDMLGPYYVEYLSPDGNPSPCAGASDGEDAGNAGQGDQ